MAQESAQDSANKDYAAELPRIPPKSPGEALSTFQIAKGFRVEQVAAEPLVADPVAVSFDENGRLYVTEMRGYSEEDSENLSRIRLLTDSNGDGKFDQSSIFAEGLSWPTAVFCYGGGIFVADAPNIYFLQDTNNDQSSSTDRPSVAPDGTLVVPAAFQSGNLGRNKGITEGYASVDLRLARAFFLTERVRFDVIAEGFNLFNRFNPASSSPFFNDVNAWGQREGTRYYSRPTAAFDPRQFQFGLKLNW